MSFKMSVKAPSRALQKAAGSSPSESANAPEQGPGQHPGAVEHQGLWTSPLRSLPEKGRLMARLGERGSGGSPRSTLGGPEMQ